MRILLTNDDGYDAPGLLALHRAVRELADVRIDVIAPACAQSGKGHCVSAGFDCRRVEMAELGDVTVVEGTPADCVRLAVALAERVRPDWVIAGINRGGNLGMDVHYSGTTAAAREAAVFGIPAVAVSQLVRPGLADDWPRATGEAAAVLAAILRTDRPAPPIADGSVYDHARRALAAGPGPGQREPGRWWNINLPTLEPGQSRAGLAVVPLSTDPLAIDYRRWDHGDGHLHLEYAGAYFDRPVSEGTDVAAAFAGLITVTPVGLVG